MADRSVIRRIWRGWTQPKNADRYEALLRGEVFPSIVARGIDGFGGVELLRAEASGEGGDDVRGGEIEFVTIMTFDSWAAVKEFAGADYEAAYVPPSARRLLSRWDERSRHYEVRLSAGR